jgi:peptidoglycan/LPS O-acetylase OafA/YrhL
LYDIHTFPKYNKFELLKKGAPHMIKSIQSLRAIAAISVVLFHCGAKIAEISPGVHYNLFHLFDSGVDLFYIISGFVIPLSIKSNSSDSAWRFLIHRFIRIVPLYWFTTSLFIGLLLFSPHIFQTYKFDFWHSIYSYLFLPQLRRPVISIGWTLVYLMYFYIVFALTLAIVGKSKVNWLIFVFVCSYLIGLYFPYYKRYPAFELITSELLLEFGMGLLFYFLYQKNIRINFTVAAGMIISGIFLCYLLQGMPRLYSYGMPMALIFCGVVLSPKELLNVTLLQYMGNLSYSLYLVQVFTVPACGILTKKLSFNPVGLSIPYFIFYLCVTVFAGMVLYILIERPATNYLRKCFY